jgi:hypothetical protein
MPEAVKTLPVPATKTAAMRYIMECVVTGYFFFTEGRLAAAKVPIFCAKMSERYAVLAGRNARAWSRQKDRANARLVLVPANDGKPAGDWLFWLLATEGTGPVHENEALSDARSPDTRIGWPKNYGRDGVQDWHPMYTLSARAVRSAKRGITHRLTWTMSPRFYEQMQAWVQRAAGRARSSAGKDTTHLQKAVEALRRLPGFKGVREQKRELLREANLPHGVWEALALKDIGHYVDKHLPVFRPGDTVASRLQA